MLVKKLNGAGSKPFFKSDILQMGQFFTFFTQGDEVYKFLISNSSRAVVGVKCFIKYCRIRPLFQNLQSYPYFFKIAMFVF